MAKFYSVQIKGLERAAQIPGWLEHGQRRTVDVACERIGKAVGEAAPRAGGALQASWVGEGITATTGRIHSSSPYARKIDRGAYIKAKSGKTLRFGSQHRRWVRFQPHPYTKAGLRTRGAIMRATFAQYMGNLGSGA